MVKVKRQLFSVDEYYKMAEVGIIKPTDRVELIKGEIIQMSPIKSRHAGTINILIRFFFKKLGISSSIISQNPIRLNNFTEPEPDIVLAKYQENEYLDQHPQPEDIYLVIEVADSSLEYDRKVKAPLYAEAGIPEYWIINLEEKQVEVFSQPSNGTYQSEQIAQPTDTLICTSLPLTLKASQIFR